ncbi:hypothetical protein [Mesorhizobium huakuii]|uniref:General secretion pathway protein GspK n=1 Tax=Mesorhizobium huakuii TaxID=28104 RepID=A0ABZ0VPB2_9HYPH|nr:hypothetical protein [Mesorhizobium huakuii]WQB99231.1 hypothetical protein U0R22_003407 [Mesorhizobium huakuii]
MKRQKYIKFWSKGWMASSLRLFFCRSGVFHRHSLGNSNEPYSSGFALVAVLVFLLIVSAITSSFALTAWTRLKIASNETESERLGLLAEGLTNVLAARLSGDGADFDLPLNFEPVSCAVGEGL